MKKILETELSYEELQLLCEERWQYIKELLAERDALVRHGSFTNIEGRCGWFKRCRICNARWEYEIEPPNHKSNCPLVEKNKATRKEIEGE